MLLSSAIAVGTTAILLVVGTDSIRGTSAHALTAADVKKCERESLAKNNLTPASARRIRIGKTYWVMKSTGPVQHSFKKGETFWEECGGTTVAAAPSPLAQVRNDVEALKSRTGAVEAGNKTALEMIRTIQDDVKQLKEAPATGRGFTLVPGHPGLSQLLSMLIAIVVSVLLACVIMYVIWQRRSDRQSSDSMLAARRADYPFTNGQERAERNEEPAEVGDYVVVRTSPARSVDHESHEIYLEIRDKKDSGSMTTYLGTGPWNGAWVTLARYYHAEKRLSLSAEGLASELDAGVRAHLAGSTVRAGKPGVTAVIGWLQKKDWRFNANDYHILLRGARLERAKAPAGASSREAVA